MAMGNPLPRRREILSTGAAAIAAAPLFVPQSAFGANEKINYAVIATGGRGRYVSRVFQKLGAQCVALCDVYEPYVAEAKKDAPGAKVYGDYRELLAEEKGLDAVLIASPDHHHCPMLLASVAAKKDVYAEKPLSKTLEESVKMIRAVRESKQVVQIGMQRRSAPAIHRAKKLVDEGVLGRVSMVKAQWHWNISKPLDNSPLPGKLDWPRFLGDAPKRALEPMRFHRCRYFHDCLIIRNIKGKRSTSGVCRTYFTAHRAFMRCVDRHGLGADWHKSDALAFKHYHKDAFNRLLDDAKLRYTNDNPPKKRDLARLHHTYICFSLERGVAVADIAQNCRTSIHMIDKHYAKWRNVANNHSLNQHFRLNIDEE